MSLVKQENGFHPSPNHQVENKITSIINRYTTVATTNGSTKKENPAACIFVASLNKDMSDEDLNMSVFNHFKQWGQLLNVKVLKDGLRRPYAFVQFEFEKDSKKALQEAPGTFINGRSIRCEPARVNRSICLISFNQPFNKKFLQNSLSAFGELEDISILQPHGKFHYVFIKFKYRDDAIKAYMALKCSDFGSAVHNGWFIEWASNLDLNNMYGGIATTSGGGTLSLANMMNSRVLDRFSIFVGNLPETITERELRDQFRLYGAIDHLQLIRKSTSSSRTSPKKVFAFIRYGNEIDTARAIDQENGTSWDGRVIRVCYREYHHNFNATPISHGGMATAMPHYFYYYHPFLNKCASMLKQQQQIMPPSPVVRPTAAINNGTGAAAQLIEDNHHSGAGYYFMPYCHAPPSAAATTRTTTIYDPNSYAYMMAANSGIIPSSAEKSSTSFSNNKTNNMTTTAVPNATATTTTTTAGAFYAYNGKDNYYPYSAATTAMVYYTYPPPYNGAAGQPYYYHNGMCYSNGTAAAAHVSHQKDITKGHTSSGDNGVTTA